MLLSHGHICIRSRITKCSEIQAAVHNDSASILFVFTFSFLAVLGVIFTPYFREKKGMKKHFTFMFLLKSTTCKLQYCVLLGLEKKTGEGRLSSDRASKIMALTATSLSPQILCVYIPGFSPFSV